MLSTTVSPKIGQAMAIATSRHNEARQQKLSVLYKAIDTVKNTPQWANGEKKVIFAGTLQGKPASIDLINSKEGINLVLFVGRFESEPFRTAYFDPVLGLQISVEASEQKYLDWNYRVRKAMG